MTDHPQEPPATPPLEHDQDFEEGAMETLEHAGAVGTVRMAHPPGLALLFFTEMWERFSYYGMRALLVLFMVAQIPGTGRGGVGGGLGIDFSHAGKIYGVYTSLVYLTPVFGGMIADKLIGTHRSMLIGGIIIAMGHIALASMDLFTGGAGGAVSLGQHIAFFSGLGLIILGTGFFKPCVSVMVGQLYKEHDPRRDAGFTIFYMGINLGAFFSALVCGWLASRFGWWAGFGAAAVGMIAGLIVYSIGRPKLLKGIGLPPKDRGPAGPILARIGLSILALAIPIAVYVLLGHLASTPPDQRAPWLSFASSLSQEVAAPVQMWYFVALVVATIAGIGWFVLIQEKHERGPTAALFIIAFFVIFFWYAFEQAGSSMNVFAQQRTQRAWTDGAKTGVIESGNLGDIWSGMGTTTFHRLSPARADTMEAEPATDSAHTDATHVIANPFNEGAGVISTTLRSGDSFTTTVDPKTTVAQLATTLNTQSKGLLALTDNEAHDGVVLTDSTQGGALFVHDKRGEAARDLRIISQREFPAAWFQSVNSLFIIIFAPLIAFLWVALAKRKLEPSISVKMAYGLILLGLGFVFMTLAAKISDGGHYIAPGATETQNGATRLVRVSAMWLVAVYFMHTMGELFLSPIGLSLTTKLAPKKWASFMMGVWFLAPSIAQLIGGFTFAYIEPIQKGEAFKPIIGGQADFFLVFVITSITAGVVMLAISPILKRLIGGRG